jgi:hypothetical protein
MPLDSHSTDSEMSSLVWEPALVKFNVELLEGYALAKCSLFSTGILPVRMGLKLQRNDLGNIPSMSSVTLPGGMILPNSIEGRLKPLLEELYRFQNFWQEQIH